MTLRRHVPHVPVAPEGEERIGDVSNVTFCNAAVARKDGSVFICNASSDTRCHVAATSLERLLDYVINTPADPLGSYACVQVRNMLIEKNLALLAKTSDPLLKRAR